ncbi:MAG: hypothetical protein HFG81_12010 [Dorea sp.]|nr:hypothetical protein [Dorea sp.]
MVESGSIKTVNWPWSFRLKENEPEQAMPSRRSGPKQAMPGRRSGPKQATPGRGKTDPSRAGTAMQGRSKPGRVLPL